MSVEFQRLTSDFIHERELGPLLKRAKEEGVTISWVLVKDCNWKKTPCRRRRESKSLRPLLGETFPSDHPPRGPQAGAGVYHGERRRVAGLLLRDRTPQMSRLRDRIRPGSQKPPVLESLIGQVFR